MWLSVLVLPSVSHNQFVSSAMHTVCLHAMYLLFLVFSLLRLISTSPAWCHIQFTICLCTIFFSLCVCVCVCVRMHACVCVCVQPLRRCCSQQRENTVLVMRWQLLTCAWSHNATMLTGVDWFCLIACSCILFGSSCACSVSRRDEKSFVCEAFVSCFSVAPCWLACVTVHGHNGSHLLLSLLDPPT